MSAQLPIRRLYAVLSSYLGSEEDLQENLHSHEDYQALVGDPEPRFCEWAYERIAQRKFVEGVRSLLRPNDVRNLARQAGVFEDGLDALVLLGKTLAAMGVHEPEVPRPVQNGVLELVRFDRWMNDVLNGPPKEQLEQTDVSLNPSAMCRRAAERLLKVVAGFYLDAGLGGPMTEVWKGSKHGFRSPAPDASPDEEIWKLDLGTLNPFLKAASEELQRRGERPRFMRKGDPLWADGTYRAVDALNASLVAEVHDKAVGERERLQRQGKAVHGLLQLVQKKHLVLPGVVQFFRKFHDGHALHFEGYRDDETLIRCFESQEYELHRPYLFMSATNPSSVDAVCIEVPGQLFKPI